MTGLDAEVLVVGGGPAGAATALLLARRGYDVLLLERARFPREKPCAEYLSPGVVDVLARLGVLAAVRALDPCWLRGMRLIVPPAEWRLSYAAERDADRARAALGVPRPLFDRALLDAARAAGVRVREGVAATSAVVAHGAVVGVAVRAPSGADVVRAHFVVAADGLHSAVARSLGLDRPVRWPRRLGLVARYAGSTRIRDYGEMHVGRGAYCGLAPVGPGLVNVGLVTDLGAKPAGEPAERYFERRLAELPGVVEALGDARRVTPVRGAGPLARRLRRVAGPGFLLVGDAAGFLDPFTGEGIYRALRGAELAADAVERALERTDRRPAGYEAARRAVFGDKERVCWLVQGFLSSPRLLGYVVRHLAERPALSELLAGVLGDYRPAAPALRAGFVWSLLRP